MIKSSPTVLNFVCDFALLVDSFGHPVGWPIKKVLLIQQEMLSIQSFFVSAGWRSEQCDYHPTSRLWSICSLGHGQCHHKCKAQEGSRGWVWSRNPCNEQFWEQTWSSNPSSPSFAGGILSMVLFSSVSFEQVILNKDTPLSCEPTLLPEPNHVMINHLYALSIKDGVMVISSTQRFRKKYVTTLLYKPIEA